MTPTDLCASIRDDLSTLFECTAVPRKGVRVRTPFLYPDGGVVDVFVLERDGQYLLTDHGEALGWLRMQSTRGRLSAKQQRLVDDVCLTLGVDLDRGQLSLHCEKRGQLMETVHRLGQAVVRVADLWFTFRTRAVETVVDEVGDWLNEKAISFSRSVKRTGRSGRKWVVDYEVVGDVRTSFVFLLSTGSRAAARRVTEHVLAGCVDLYNVQDNRKTGQPSPALISLFDDTNDVWQDEDFRLIENNAEIARWSRPDEFERILKAA